MRAPDPDDGRWRWGLVTRLLDALEHAGYRRCDDDTHVGQARHLLHLAARIYAGETQPPSGSPGRPQLSIGQSAAAAGTARQAITAFDSTGGAEGFLAVLGAAPDRDRAARCARAFGHALADLQRVPGVIDDLTGGAS